MRLAIVLFALLVFGLTGISYGDDGFLYPTIPGTRVRDYSQPGLKYVPRDKTWYPTIPGTSVRDFSKGGYTVRGDQLIPTIPGTRVPDYRRPWFKLDD